MRSINLLRAETVVEEPLLETGELVRIGLAWLGTMAALATYSVGFFACPVGQRCEAFL